MGDITLFIICIIYPGCRALTQSVLFQRVSTVAVITSITANEVSVSIPSQIATHHLTVIRRDVNIVTLSALTQRVTAAATVETRI